MNKAKQTVTNSQQWLSANKLSLNIDKTMHVIFRNKNIQMGKIALFVRDCLYKDKIQIFHKCYYSRNTVHSHETRNRKQLIEPKVELILALQQSKALFALEYFSSSTINLFLWFLSYIIYVIVLLSYIIFVIVLYCLVSLLHWNCHAVMIMSMLLLFFLSVTNKINASFLGNHPTFV